MNMARLAYYLTRLEELTRETDRDKFKTFKNLFYSLGTQIRMIRIEKKQS